jgi:hypothetical protein
MVALRERREEWEHRERRLRLVEEAPLRRVRRDMLPDYADYCDTGCEFAPRCTRCPLRRCKDDDPPAGPASIHARDREIVLLRRRHRVPINILAGTYGLTRRSIFRILRDTR